MLYITTYTYGKFRMTVKHNHTPTTYTTYRLETKCMHMMLNQGIHTVKNMHKPT